MVVSRARKTIVQGQKDISKILSVNMERISSQMISDIMKNWDKLPQSKKYLAVKDVEAKGLREFSYQYKNVLSKLATTSVKEAVSELGIRTVKLGPSSFDNLPSSLKSRIAQQSNQFIATAIGNFEKGLFFKFDSMSDSDSRSKLEYDLGEYADSWITGSYISTSSLTQSSMVVNESRQSAFLSGDAEDEIGAFEFYNPDPESEICKYLNGWIFSKDDPQLFNCWAPLHFNCKSIIRVLKKVDPEDIVPLPSDAELEDNGKQF